MKEDDLVIDDFLVLIDWRNLFRWLIVIRYGWIIVFLGRIFIRKRRILLGFYIVWFLGKW